MLQTSIVAPMIIPCPDDGETSLTLTIPTPMTGALMSAKQLHIPCIMVLCCQDKPILNLEYQLQYMAA